VIRKTGITILGWLLTLAGLAALVLPGPGLLLMVVGLVVLSQEYDWAERRLEPVKAMAFAVAAAGVSSWVRIGVSALAALCLIAVGVVWALDPEIPTLWIVGPRLPFAGWPTASTLLLSGLIALALLVYSIRRFRGLSPDQASEQAYSDHASE
jgi:Putative transmembrane protein (PGPGW)